MSLKKRLEHQPPKAIAKWGWKYHHTGIPTNNSMKNERYIPHLKMYVSGFDHSPFGIEWMRFEKDSPVHPLVQKNPHVAFEVEDIDHEIDNHNLNVLTPPEKTTKNIRVAMVENNGAPVELIEFQRNLPGKQN